MTATSLCGRITRDGNYGYGDRLCRETPTSCSRRGVVGNRRGACRMCARRRRDREICWPWNLVRDRRTPRASLPGADLVGFYKEDDAVLLLFGEVKTSSDQSTPPNVMNGSGGMAWQLKEEATRLDIQHSLLKWLRARCVSPDHRWLYRAAVERYVRSLGKEILLVGILLRDTKPNELDVTARAKFLAASLGSPTRIEISAWYLPIPIKHWPALLHEGTP